MLNYSEPFLSRHPWFAGVLLGTVATPAGVVLAWVVPRPLDAIVALPLVLIDAWAPTGTVETTADSEARGLRLLLLVLGIVLTWVFYIIVARLLLWRLSRPSGGEV